MNVFVVLICQRWHFSFINNDICHYVSLSTMTMKAMMTSKILIICIIVAKNDSFFFYNYIYTQTQTNSFLFLGYSRLHTFFRFIVKMPAFVWKQKETGRSGISSQNRRCASLWIRTNAQLFQRPTLPRSQKKIRFSLILCGLHSINYI